mgnify:CR=1 FL=1
MSVAFQQDVDAVQGGGVAGQNTGTDDYIYEIQERIHHAYS